MLSLFRDASSGKPVGTDEAMRALSVSGRVDYRRCNLAWLGYSANRKNYGVHSLCRSGLPTQEQLQQQSKFSCTAISYGIEDSYDFELQYANRTGCRVFALDPTRAHKSMLTSNANGRWHGKEDYDRQVFFMHWGAPVKVSHIKCKYYRNCTETVHDGKPEPPWFLVGPARLAQLVAPSGRIALLKMDCEGCEYSVYEDVIKYEPRFFERVEQVVLEVHLPRQYAPTDDDFLQYGKLLALMLRAGIRLQHREPAFCSGDPGQWSGITPLVSKSGYYRRYTGLQDNAKPRIQKQCENLLFARPPSRPSLAERE